MPSSALLPPLRSFPTRRSSDLLLEGVEPPVTLQPFDRGDRVPFLLQRQDGATLHRAPVHMDRAGAALARIAADVGTGEIQLVAQRSEEHTSELQSPM